jgi:predicted acetyltransferase
VDVEIRTIEPGEFDAYLRVFSGAFSDALAEEEVEMIRRVTEFDRCLVALDGGTFVGAASANAFRMTVPGGTKLPVAGVTGVGVLPTHRRRGVNTALMSRQLADVLARGEAGAILHASEGGIYGRFGYGVATMNAAIDVETRHSAFVGSRIPSGGIHLLDRSDALPRMRAIHEAVRPTRPGEVALDERWFDDHLWQRESERKEEPYFFAVHESEDGSDDAYAVYHVKHHWDDAVPGSELKVEEVIAIDPDAHADAWRFLFDVDLVQRVTARNLPADEPLLHLLAEPRRLNLKLRDGLYLRLLDVCGALAARTFAVDGRVVIDLADPFIPEIEGRYELVVRDGRGTCSVTSADADLACSVVELGAAYLGGTTFRQLARAGRVGEASGGALARADAMFGWDPAPWCSVDF